MRRVGCAVGASEVGLLAVRWDGITVCGGGGEREELGGDGWGVRRRVLESVQVVEGCMSEACCGWESMRVGESVLAGVGGTRGERVNETGWGGVAELCWGVVRW